MNKVIVLVCTLAILLFSASGFANDDEDSLTYGDGYGEGSRIAEKELQNHWRSIKDKPDKYIQGFLAGYKDQITQSSRYAVSHREIPKKTAASLMTMLTGLLIVVALAVSQ